VPICEKRRIFAAFSVDFRVICALRKTASNPRRLNLAVFPIHVKGFVAGRRERNKHALGPTDFHIFEISCKSSSCNKSSILFRRLRDEGNQQQPSSSACRLTPPIHQLHLSGNRVYQALEPFPISQSCSICPPRRPRKRPSSGRRSWIPECDRSQ